MDKIFSPIKLRIFHFIENIGITKEKFYESTELSASNFKGLGAKSELGGEKIVKILTSFPQLSADWLILGKGKMLRAQPSVSESTEPPPPATPPPEPPPGACTGCLLRDKVIASLEKTIASQEKTIATLEDSLKQARQPHGQKRKAG